MTACVSTRVRASTELAQIYNCNGHKKAYFDPKPLCTLKVYWTCSTCYPGVKRNDGGAEDEDGEPEYKFEWQVADPIIFFLLLSCITFL